MTQKALTVEVSLPLLMWRENSQIVAFTPALDLATCGETEQEAVQNFEEAVELFFETAHERRTLVDLLESLGWEPIFDSWKVPSAPMEGSRSFNVRLPSPAALA